MSELSDRVTVEKDDKRIEIHPDVLANHLALGWKLVEKPVAEPEPAESVEVKHSRRKK